MKLLSDFCRCRAGAWASLLLVFFFGAACDLGDTVAPAQPASFSYDPASRRFDWISAGDDGGGGFGLVTDIRSADTDITSEPALVFRAFEDLPLQRKQFGETSPRVAGNAEYLMGRRPDPTGPLYHFIQIRDEVNNSSLPAVAPSGPTLTNIAQLSLRTAGIPGAVSSRGDVNGDGLRDLVAVDASAGNERLYVYFGRDPAPYRLLDVEDGALPDPVNDVPGDCAAAPARQCVPDIVMDVSALGGLFGSSARGTRPRSLDAADVTGDGRAEILVGAPAFQVPGEAGNRGAVFVFSFPQTFLSLRSGEEPLWWMRNPVSNVNYLGRVADIEPAGLVVDDIAVVLNDLMPDDPAPGVGIASRARDDAEWRLYEGVPLQPDLSLSCPGAVVCTGDDLIVTQNSARFESLSFNGIRLDGDFLFTLFDGLGNVEYAAPVLRFESSEAGFFNRIVVDWPRGSAHPSALTTSGNRAFALYRQIESGDRLATDSNSGSPANPISLGNFRRIFDPSDTSTVVTVLNPMDLTAVPVSGEEYPLATFLGPDDGSLLTMTPVPTDGSFFGETVSGGGDFNLDGVSDIAVGAPGLHTLPGRYGGFDLLEDRGGALVVYGSAVLGQDDVATAGTLSDGVYDFGPAGSDRPAVVVLGRGPGEEAGAALSATRTRISDGRTPERFETAGLALGFAVGAPGACPTVLLPGDLVECDASRVGAVYLFSPHPEFEARDYKPLGFPPTGIWDLFGDPANANTAVASVEIWGETDGDELGESLAVDLDLNGDHIFDIVIGAPGANGGDGRLYGFLVTTAERTPAAFTRTIEPSLYGQIPSGTYFRFETRGNVDFSKRVDDDEDGALEPREDRCLFCVYDLALGFAVNPVTLSANDLFSSGPDILVEGGANTNIGSDVTGGFVNRDAYEDIVFPIEDPGNGEWIGVLNGVTSLLVQHRAILTTFPPDSPSLTNYVDTGGGPGVFVDVPGNAGGAVQWWVDKTVEGTATRLGQVRVELEPIYQATSLSLATLDDRVFGRVDTDNSAAQAGTVNTAELRFDRRTYPDDDFRWNVVTTGGLFPQGGSTADPFDTRIEALSMGGDANGDAQPDLLYFLSSGELRFGY